MGSSNAIRRAYAGGCSALGRLATNPILVKELRTAFRGWRFLTTHVLLVAGVGTAVLGVIAVHAHLPSSYLQPYAIGRQVFEVLQILQLAAVALTVPAFAVNSVVSERDRQTYDCLVTTSMTPAGIVWGKFAAVMSYALLFLASGLPLVSLCFLYGGVTVGEIAGTYAVLALASALLAAYALFASAASRTLLRALLSAYAVIGLVGFGLAGLLETPPGAALAEAYGFRHFVVNNYWAMRGAPAYGPLATVVAPAFAYATLFAVFFLGAVNQVKPAFSNRTTNMRVLNLVFATWATSLGLVFLREAEEASASRTTTAAALESFLLAELMVVTLAVFFAGENPDMPAPVRIRDRGGARRGLERALNLFLPGPVRGARYALASALLVVGTAVGAIAWMGGETPHLGEFTGAAVTAGGVLILFVFAVGEAALVLSTYCRSLVALAKGITGGAALALVLAPLVTYGVVWGVLLRGPGGQEAIPGAWAAASPAVAILSAVERARGILTRYRSDWPTAVSIGGLEAPPELVCGALYGAAGLALGVWARRRLARIGTG